jgi:phosphatidylglycerophosphate synthase
VRVDVQRVPSCVVDRALRPWKRRLYAPATRWLAGWPADAVTLAAAATGLLAALLAALGRFDLALLAWWSNRALDGLDGELARAARRRGAGGSAQRGAYLDLMADLLVYAALPLGLAAGAAGTWTGSAAAPALADSWAVWGAAAAALGAFYLNLGSWSLLAAALAEAEGPRRSRDDDASAADTGVRMPAGLMEGAETIVAFTVALLWPAGAVWTLATIAALTFAGALHRSWWGARRLALVVRP